MIAVTGACGGVGRRVVALLRRGEQPVPVVAVDRVARPPHGAGEFRQIDVVTGDPDVFVGCDQVIHLAEDPGRRADPRAAAAGFQAMLQRVDRAGCRRLVVVSSALVYGARPGNPVPLTESHEPCPTLVLGYARAKAALEELAQRWASRTGAELAILRPTTTLSEERSGYVASALRTAIALRDEEVDVPVQFLHEHDLAAAVALLAGNGATGMFNVAPDHWIEPAEFAELMAEIELPRPPFVTTVAGHVGAVIRPEVARGLAPYVRYPWVVANDRLRAEGWKPSHTNEEALVAGTPTPPWRSAWVRRRQELALGAAGLTTAGMMAGAGFAARWVLRGR